MKTGVIGVDGSGRRDREELLVGGGLSFGGGIGGECLEEPAANLNTLSEAKREDDEVDCCFWPDPPLFVVAIVGRGGCPGSSVGGCRIQVPSRSLGSSPRLGFGFAYTPKSRFGFVWWHHPSDWFGRSPRDIWLVSTTTTLPYVSNFTPGHPWPQRVGFRLSRSPCSTCWPRFLLG